MAFKEQKAWTAFKAISIGLLNLHRIENAITAGMPDVIAINRKGAVFWLELKALDDWPKRDSTAPLKGKFEKGQIGFLREWRSWNGFSFVLLRVGVEFFLLDPRQQLDQLSKVDLQANAVIVRGKLEVLAYLEALG